MATDTRDDTILVCSDDPAVLAALPALGRLGYGAARCATLPELRHALQRPALAVVLDLALDRRTPFLALRPAPGSEQAAWRPAWSAELGHAEHEEVARKPLSTDELCLRLHALLLRCGALPPRALDFWGASRAAPGRRAEGRVVCVFGAK